MPIAVIVQAFFAMLVGMAAGSFINVVAHRVPKGMSILNPGSRCVSCDAPIAWFDNIPVVSWLILRGRCRSCGARFSPRYAVVELATGLLFAGAMLHAETAWLFARDALFLSLLVCAVLTDLDEWIILDTVSIGGTVAGLAFSLAPGGIGLLRSGGAALGALLLFSGIRLVSVLLLRRRPGYTIAPEGHEDEADEFQGGMGWGDIKMAAMVGAFLGPERTVVALFASFLVGAVVGVGTLLGGRDRRVPIPFGPFLALGAVVSLFAGGWIWGLYMGAARGGGKGAPGR